MTDAHARRVAAQLAAADAVTCQECGREYDPSAGHDCPEREEGEADE